ncbi:hypothetical protein MMC28_009073 [Mycoblastus sanguinarius]|nr:hypothetical protein [Mycoblastus sanguinarius]
MAEAHRGYAVLKEVDQGTFSRFIEWAYKGYYTAAGVRREVDVRASPVNVSDHGQEETKPLALQSEELAPEALEEPTEVAEELAWPEPAMEVEAPPLWEEPSLFRDEVPKWTFGTEKKSKKTKSKKAETKESLKESFIHRKVTIRRESISIPPSCPNKDSSEDYTDVFLSHARVYVFADKYFIQPLKLLALEELQTSLAIYTLYRRRTGDIVALLRYSYANTGDSVRHVEDLRTLLRHYIGYEMDTLIKDPEFRELMVKDGGALLGDFTDMVAKRIR